MERGDLAEFGKKNATQMMIFLPIENVGRKIKSIKLLSFPMLQIKKTSNTYLQGILNAESIVNADETSHDGI